MVLLFINCFVFNLVLLKIGIVYNYKKVRYLKLIWYVFLYFENDGRICWVINRCYLIYFIGVFKIGVKFDILYDFEFYVLEVGCWLGFGEVFNFYGYR